MVAPPQLSSSAASARRAALARGGVRVRRGWRRRAPGIRRRSRLLPAFQRSAHRRLAALGHQRAVARREFLHLAHVVGEAFGRGVDRGQPAADHHHRQPELQIGDGGQLRRAGQLQRHQEIRRLRARRAPGRSGCPARSACRRPCTARCGRSPSPRHRPSTASRRRRSGRRRNARTARAVPAAGAPASGSSCSSAR